MLNKLPPEMLAMTRAVDTNNDNDTDSTLNNSTTNNNSNSHIERLSAECLKRVQVALPSDLVNTPY